MDVKSRATYKNILLKQLKNANRYNWLYSYVLTSISLDSLIECKNIIDYYKSADAFSGVYALCVWDGASKFDIVETNEFTHCLKVMEEDKNALLKLNVLNSLTVKPLDGAKADDVVVVKVSKIDITESKIDVYVEMVKKADMDYGLNCPGWRFFLSTLNIFGFQHSPVNYDTLNIGRVNQITGERLSIADKCKKLWVGYLDGLYTFDMINEIVSYDTSLYALAIDYALHANEYSKTFENMFNSLSKYNKMDDIVEAIRVAMTYYTLVAPKRMWNAGLSVASMVEESFKALRNINYNNVQQYADINTEYMKRWFTVRPRLKQGLVETNSYNLAELDYAVYSEEFKRLAELEQCEPKDIQGDVQLIKHIYISEVYESKSKNNRVKEYALKFNTESTFVCGLSFDIEASFEVRLDMLMGNEYTHLNELGIQDWYKVKTAGDIVILDDVYNSRYLKVMVLDRGVEDLSWIKDNCKMVMGVKKYDRVKQLMARLSGLYGIKITGEINHTAIQHVYPDIKRE